MHQARKFQFQVSFNFKLSWWDIFNAFPGERNGQKNITGLAKVHKRVLANVALILELRLLTKKERKERSNFTKRLRE